LPVDSQHSQYKKRITQWVRCRDVIEGSDAVKERKTVYLPALSGQEPTEYDAYMMRALFYGASQRTVQGLLGATFRKDYNVEYPFEEQLDNITSDGLNLEQFSRVIVREALTTGRLGILVDADSTALLRPYAAIYSAENIVNWNTTKREGQFILSLVVLKETYSEQKEGDAFVLEEKTQYRVLSLERGTRYKQEVYRKHQQGTHADQWAVDPRFTVYPTRSGVPLDFIPFQFVNSTDLTVAAQKPPLMDLVETNLSHYRSSADLEHGAHFTALPTPWLAGFNPDSTFKIGSGVAWVTEELQAKAGMLEYTGQGLEALEKRLDKKEQMMAILGARILEEPKRSVEATDTHRLRRSGETGALSAIVGTCSNAIENVLTWIAQWSGATDAQLEDIEFDLNNDFYDIEMEPQMLEKLMGALQTGSISQDTFLWNLKVGEVLPPGRTIDEEKDLINSESGGLETPTEATDNVTPIRRSLNVVYDEKTGRPSRIEEA